jgi:hypothetical protein
MKLNMHKDKEKEALGLPLRALQDIAGVDNCWNCPAPVLVDKGEILRYTTDGGSRAGNISFEREVDKSTVFLREPYAESLSPYCRGILDTEYLEPVDWPQELLDKVTVK